MISFDYTLLLIIPVLIFLFYIAFTTGNNLYRIASHIGILVILVDLISPIFFVIYLGFLAYHINIQSKRAKGIIPVIFLCLLIAPMLALADNHSANGGNNQGGGLPSVVERVEVVEEVLEVKQITQQPSAQVFGTDYLPGDNGKLMTYLKIGEFPLETASCRVSVLYPNMTYFINNQLMIPATQQYFEGLYFHDFIAPNQTGVYPVNAVCFYNATSSFEIPISLELPVNNTDEDLKTSGSLNNLEAVDGLFHVLEGEGKCKDVFCRGIYNFDLPIGFYTDTLADARIIWQGSQDNDDEVKEFWVVNGAEEYFWFNLSSKNIVENHQFVINESFENATNFSVEIRAFSWDGGKIEQDYFVSSRAYNASYVNDLRGNSELVISEAQNQILNNTEQLLNADIQVIDSQTLGHFLVIGLFSLLLFTGYLLFASLILIFYSFIYTEGVIAIVLLVFGAILFYSGWNKRKEK